MNNNYQNTSYWTKGELKLTTAFSDIQTESAVRVDKINVIITKNEGTETCEITGYELDITGKLHRKFYRKFITTEKIWFIPILIKPNLLSSLHLGAYPKLIPTN